MTKSKQLVGIMGNGHQQPRRFLGRLLHEDNRTSLIFGSVAVIAVLSVSLGLYRETTKPKKVHAPITVKASDHTTDMPKSGYTWIRPLVDKLAAQAKQNDQTGQ